jgi:hypothetical protein
MPNSGKTTRTIVWAIVALFVTTMLVVAYLSTAVESSAAAALVASLLGNLSALAAVLVNLQRTANVESTVNDVARDTHDLRNGLLDAKVRSGVADVLPDHLVDPAASHQLRQDRARIEEAHRDNGDARTGEPT